MAGGVFISYRREDLVGFTRAIYDRLANTLGSASVFLDVDNIPAGLDFVDVLSDRIGQCDALIAVMGKNWLASSDGHNRRLDDPNDFVRIEIEAALARGIRVIPVLVDGATMPRPEDLPESLRKLARRQSVEISSSRFDSDVSHLTRILAMLKEQVPRSSSARPESNPPLKALGKSVGTTNWWFIAVIVLVAICLSLLSIQFGLTPAILR